MKEKKKLNLLPAEVQQKYSKKYMMYAVLSVFAILLTITGVQYGRCCVITWQTERIRAENARYDEEKDNIAQLQTEIEQYKDFMDSYENNHYFPFARFMFDLELKRPSDVYIISLDTDDRLINEGVHEETVNDAKKEENSAKEPEPSSEGQAERDIVIPEIKYETDVVGKTLTLRGYSKNQAAISKFIYEISNLPYITNAMITGVEEHKMPDGILYNIFEIKVVGGVM